MLNYLTFTPIYQERVWGGRGLEHSLGRKLPEDKVIGESWELVDREEANSQGKNGTGSLRQLRSGHTEELMGPGWPAERPFPILVKWLDCQQRLSLQVHPPAEIADRLNGEPKTENWYILESQPGAALLAGLKTGVSREEFLKALEKEELEGLITRHPSEPGASLFVRSGWIHAIDAGNLILEIQQNSDTTYRVYDWGRVGLDGKPRQLHVEESMESIDFSEAQPELLHPSGPESTLVDCEEFRLRRFEIAEGGQASFAANKEPRILSVVEGTLQAGDGFQATRGDNILLPYAGESSWRALGDAVYLLTDQFNRP